MATVNLGAIKFNWKGAFNNSTAYAVDDVVSSGGSSYVCILASTGNAVSNGTYWQIMAQAGTNGSNGTDVGSVITTQGDMLYRDGSGLQRLAKGTAGQHLLMNSGANAPQWTTQAAASSDFVRTAFANASGSSATLALNGCFSATYKHYKVIMNYYPGNTSAGFIRFQNTSNAELTGANYQHSGTQVSNSGSPNTSHIGSWNATQITPQENTSGDSYRFGAYEFDIFDPFKSDARTRFNMKYTAFDGSATRSVFVAGGHNETISVAGIRLFSSNGQNLNANTFVGVYGYKYN